MYCLSNNTPLLSSSSSQSSQSSQSEITDIELEASKKVLHYVHNEISKKIIPSLINLDKIFKRNTSPLQGELRKLLALIVLKDPKLLDDISARDEILSAEVEADFKNLKRTESSLPPSPVMGRMFSSHLLSEIASDGNRRKITFDIDSIDSQEDSNITLKRQPSPFESQE